MCPSKHRHGGNLFTVIPRNRSISVAFYDAHRDKEDVLSSNITESPGFESTLLSKCCLGKQRSRAIGEGTMYFPKQHYESIVPEKQALIGLMHHMTLPPKLFHSNQQCDVN